MEDKQAQDGCAKLLRGEEKRSPNDARFVRGKEISLYSGPLEQNHVIQLAFPSLPSGRNNSTSSRRHPRFSFVQRDGSAIQSMLLCINNSDVWGCLCLDGVKVEKRATKTKWQFINWATGRSKAPFPNCSTSPGT